VLCLVVLVLFAPGAVAKKSFLRKSSSRANSSNEESSAAEVTDKSAAKNSATFLVSSVVQAPAAAGALDNPEDPPVTSNAKMPLEQVFRGKHVKYADGKTAPADWQNEYADGKTVAADWQNEYATSNPTSFLALAGAHGFVAAVDAKKEDTKPPEAKLKGSDFSLLPDELLREIWKEVWQPQKCEDVPAKKRPDAELCKENWEWWEQTGLRVTNQFGNGQEQRYVNINVLNKQIGARGARMLAALLPCFPQVQILYLYGSNIGDEGAEWLFKALESLQDKTPEWVRIALYRNEIGGTMKGKFRTLSMSEKIDLV